MIWIQMAVIVLMGFLIGIGLSVLTGLVLYSIGSDVPFRLLWLEPFLVLFALLAIGFVAVMVSLWPLKNMDVTQVFSANR
ncbi:FtsX-like permease family protein [Hydrogenovibrio crunogenus]|nr:FtsX-like permease family protein [Hydrogenovibrio crunogenus]